MSIPLWLSIQLSVIFYIIAISLVYTIGGKKEDEIIEISSYHVIDKSHYHPYHPPHPQQMLQQQPIQQYQNQPYYRHPLDNRMNDININMDGFDYNDNIYPLHNQYRIPNRHHHFNTPLPRKQDTDYF